MKIPLTPLLPKKSFQARIALRLLLLAALAALFLGIFQANSSTHRVQAAKSADPAGSSTREHIASPPCIPGKGWVHAYGPFRPDLAALAVKALADMGYAAEVQASEFGERDSCGEFAPLTIDFVVRLTGVTPPARLVLQQIEPVLRRIAEPGLGTVRLTDPNGASADLTMNPLSLAALASPPASSDVLNRKVYVIAYDPIMSNGLRLHNYFHWFDTDYLDLNVINFWKSVSGDRMVYSIVGKQVLNAWPEHIDGHRYTEQEWLTAWANRTPHLPDELNYNRILNDFDICGKLNRGEIDELWLYGAPYNGGWESTLAGPGAYWFNSVPVPEPTGCNKLLPIMSYNFERDFDMALHNFGHRTESTMWHVYGSWQQNRTAHSWEQFALVKFHSPDYGYSGCGNIHFPPNGTNDYDYTNTAPMQTNCADFENYPDLSEPSQVLETVTCANWGCNHNGYLQYWYTHFPANQGCAKDGIGNDWWKYFASPAPQALEQGWLAEFWDNQNLAGYPYTCWDVPQVEFDWGSGAPYPDLPPDLFSARWTRLVNFDAGEYQFEIFHDDGTRLYIDGVKIFENWCDNCRLTDYVDHTLSAGTHEVKLEMFENLGWAGARLTWSASPADFYKSLPTNGASGVSTSPTLSWGTWSGATVYEYCYDTIANDNCDTQWIDAGLLQIIGVFNLSPGTTYYWQVRARDGSGVNEANGGEWWQFTTAEPTDALGAFSKLAPPNGATNQSNCPVLSWEAGANATGYQVCVDGTTTNSCSTVWKQTIVPGARVYNLAPNTTYFWQAYAVNSSSMRQANDGIRWSFKVKPFLKTYPRSGATNVPKRVTLTWTNLGCVSRYEFCYDTRNNNRCDMVGGWKSAGTAYLKSVSLSKNRTYYWQVRAVYSNGAIYYADNGVWKRFTTRR